MLFWDEPIAALGVKEAGVVLRLTRCVVEHGVAAVVICHVLPQVTELTDRMIVLCHGRKAAELTEDIATDRLVDLIVGFGTVGYQPVQAATRTRR